MRSMFYKLFGGIVFVTMLLSNVVMADVNSLDNKFYKVLKEVYTCKDIEKYSDDCMVKPIENVFSESFDENINKINNLYEKYTGEQPSLSTWVITVSAYTQDRRIDNEDYNKRNNINSKYVASMGSFISKYENTKVKSDALCQLLIYRAAFSDGYLIEIIDNMSLSSDQMKELESKIMNLTSGCTFKHDKNNNVEFQTLWFEDELEEYINDYYEVIQQYE